MKILYPDYNNSIANLACSILSYYGVGSANKTLPLADKFLKSKYKNVVVLLLDGMGKNIIESNLSADGFFRSNLKGIYSSTFPPTTVAATTAIESGLFPNQSAWMGWTGYFKEIDKNVNYFTNIDNDTGEQAAIFNVPYTYCPYTNICDKIKDKGTLAYCVAPYSEPFPKTYEELCNEIKRFCDLDGRKYIYSYWYEPDGTMHETGCFSKKSKKILQEIEIMTEKLADDYYSRSWSYKF